MLVGDKRKMNSCSLFIVIASLFNFAISSTEVTIQRSKSEIQANGTTNNSSSDQQFAARARQYFISNRDSNGYVNAESSFGSSQGANNHHHHVMVTSYQVPQKSYGAPSNQGYAHQGMKSGYGGGVGWGWADNSQSSKGGGGDLLGLIGLIGLKGLAGTIPIIKKAIIVFIALLPFLIPLAIIKLPILLLKPAFTFGRGSSAGTIFHNIFGSADQIRERLDFIEKFNETLTSKVTDDNLNWMVNQDALHNEIKDKGVAFGNDIIGKDADNRCMQRIACEGLFKSLPRIFFRLIGESPYILGRKRDNNRPSSKAEKEKALKVDIQERARRKDLATLAVNKLKNSQYLTKAQPVTDDIIKTEDVCKQYKCSELF